MKTYVVKIAPQANKDIRAVNRYIRTAFSAPVAAENFLRGIYDQIAALESQAGIFTISAYRDVLVVYGRNARHVMYRGFAIIYTIHGSVVVVHRIVHGSLIRE
ncbi:MAG: type II toxin-antitoxin system RelE/ParE family toxin [Tannerella sp.]|nr:type II toxin-antitoxin system RelE/ParE family toxin [Tannerella sp.]